MRAFKKFAVGLASMAVLLASAAEAHPKLMKSLPAANAVIAKTRVIKLQFSEKLIAQFSGGDLVMTDMPGMKMHAPMKMPALTSAVAADGRTLVLTAKSPLTAGAYMLNWHAVSTDTHRVQGTLAFRVK